jgi:hypothetical protein
MRTGIIQLACNERKTCVGKNIFELADHLSKFGLTLTELLGLLVTGIWL